MRKVQIAQTTRAGLYLEIQTTTREEAEKEAQSLRETGFSIRFVGQVGEDDFRIVGTTELDTVGDNCFAVPASAS